MIYLLIFFIALLFLKNIIKIGYGNFGFRNFWLYSFFIVSIVVFIISLSNPYDLYAVSSNTYILIAIFVISYLLGFISANRRKNINFKFIEDEIKNSIENLNKSNIFIAFNVFVAIFIIFFTYKYLNNFSLISDDAIRTSRFEVGIIFTSQIQKISFNYIVGTFLWFSKFILAYGLIFGKKDIKKIFYINLIICTSSLVFGGGRNIIIEILFMVLALWYFKLAFCKEKENFIKFSKKIFIIIFSLIIFVFTTYIRTINEEFSLNSMYKALEKSVEHIVVYLVGSFRSLDYAINYLELEKGYGVYTFASFNELYNIFLRTIGFDTLPYSNIWGGILSEPISIGVDKNFNALYTAVFNFYFDFGHLGVFLFSFLFGWISSKTVELFLEKPNVFSLYIVCIFFMCSFMSFLTFKLTPANIVISLIVCFIFSKYKFKFN